MAENKKGFVLYCDLIHTVEKMPKEKAGELFLHILKYVNDQNPITDDLLINLVFEPIKQQLKRDLEKYEQRRLKNIENINKRWNKNNTNVYERINSNTKNTVIDTVIVKDTVSKDISIVSLSETKQKKEADFKNMLLPFVKLYPREMLNDFYFYWTESKPKSKLLRWEKEKTFDISRRLDRWEKNGFNKPAKVDKL